MARFRYLGEPPRDNVETYGPTLQLGFRKKDGSRLSLVATNQEAGFVIGEDIGTEILDERVLRHMRADTERFEEIT
jgi:hypothetical protein